MPDRDQPPRPVWLIETGLWTNDNVARMIALLQGLGLTVHAEPFTCLGGTSFAVVGKEQPVIFYGSLSTAGYLRVLEKDWVPFIWFEEGAFSCRSYYAHWGKYLLQTHYGFYPLAELPRLKARLYRDFGEEGCVFLRPDANDKSFTGRLVPEDNFPQWYEEAQAGTSEPAALVVVSAPVRIESEWRFVIADGEVVAGSAYRGGGSFPGPDGRLRNAALFAEEVAAEPWQPRPIYCLDVAYTGAGQYRLVELTEVNSAGLYRCELLPVIQAMNRIAVRDFQSWRGKPLIDSGDSRHAAR